MRAPPQTVYSTWQLAAVLLTCGASLVGCFPGCLGGDPWPPPDPFTDDGGGSSDTTRPVTWPDDQGPLPRNIFCSAPSTNGIVTIAGLPGAVPRGDRLAVTSASGQSAVFEVSSDGSFAGSIHARPLERLHLVASQSGAEGQSIDVLVSAGQRIGYEGKIDGLILGDGSEIFSPDDEGQVLVHGDGQLLQSGTVVVGANTTASTAASTMISCSPSCQFDLFLPGSRNDQIGLFLVVSGQQAGFTEPETIAVP